MTEAMPFLQKAILLSYDPRPLGTGLFARLHKGVRLRPGPPPSFWQSTRCNTQDGLHGA